MPSRRVVGSTGQALSHPNPYFGLCAALALSGCATVDFYAQSVTGHLGLMARARPVESVIAAPERNGLRERHRVAAERRAAFLDLVWDTRRGLEAVYESSRSDAEKRAEKVRAFAGLRSRYATLRSAWTSGPTYDFWFERKVNNAACVRVDALSRVDPRHHGRTLKPYMVGQSGSGLETSDCAALVDLRTTARPA